MASGGTEISCLYSRASAAAATAASPFGVERRRGGGNRPPRSFIIAARARNNSASLCSTARPCLQRPPSASRFGPSLRSCSRTSTATSRPAYPQEVSLLKRPRTCSGSIPTSRNRYRRGYAMHLLTSGSPSAPGRIIALAADVRPTHLVSRPPVIPAPTRAQGADRMTFLTCWLTNAAT